MTKILGLAVAVISVAAFVGTATASQNAQHAKVAKKPITSGFYRGRTISYYDFGPIKLMPGNKLAPIWTVTNPAPGQHNIVDTVPGQSDYTPLWQLNKVTFKSGVRRTCCGRRSDVEAATRPTARSRSFGRRPSSTALCSVSARSASPDSPPARRFTTTTSAR